METQERSRKILLVKLNSILADYTVYMASHVQMPSVLLSYSAIILTRKHIYALLRVLLLETETKETAILACIRQDGVDNVLAPFKSFCLGVCEAI